MSASTVRSQTFSVRAILKMKKDMYHLKLLSTSKSPVALRSQNLNLPVILFLSIQWAIGSVLRVFESYVCPHVPVPAAREFMRIPATFHNGDAFDTSLTEAAGTVCLEMSVMSVGFTTLLWNMQLLLHSVGSQSLHKHSPT